MLLVVVACCCFLYDPANLYDIAIAKLFYTNKMWLPYFVPLDNNNAIIILVPSIHIVSELAQKRTGDKSQSSYGGF